MKKICMGQLGGEAKAVSFDVPNLERSKEEHTWP
jgi:hypothetical protein